MVLIMSWDYGFEAMKLIKDDKDGSEEEDVCDDDDDGAFYFYLQLQNPKSSCFIPF